MADNVAITPGTGNTVAADEVVDGTLGTVKVQYVKIMDGTLDGTTKAAVGATGVAFNQAGINGVAPSVGNGVSGTGVQRVTLASDGTGVVGLIAGTAIVGSVGIDQTTPGTTNAVSSTASKSTSATLQNAVSATGNGSTLSVDGMATVVATVSGTFTATITFEGTEDGSTWQSILASRYAATTIASTTTSAGVFEVPVSGLVSFRARVTWTSGTSVTVTAHAVPNSSSPRAINANIVANTATNQSTNVAQINAVTVSTGNGVSGTGVQRVTIASDSTGVVGSSTATGSAIPANAFYGGAIAKTALPSAATDANLVGVMSDKFGRLVTINNAIRDIVGTQTTTISASTSETTIVTAVASTFNDVTLITVSNTSATATRVDFRDTTAGSVLFSLYIPAGDVRGVSVTQPIPQTSVNTNWTAQSSTSVTDLRVYVQFIKNK